MPDTFATFVAPVPRRFIAWGKEAAGASGTVVAPTFTFPMTTFTPVDKITELEDSAWRNAMAKLYNLIPGVRIADLSMGGPVFGDGIGYPLANILGDYYQSVNGTAGSAGTLTTTTAIGAGTIVTSAVVGTGTTVAIGSLGTTAEEVRTALTISAGPPYTVVLNGPPLYQAHTAGAAITPYTSVTTYAHHFALLNSGAGMGGYSQAQGPTYSVYDDTGLPATYGARIYAYTCLSEMTMTGNPADLFMWDAKATALASVIAGTAPTSAPSTVAPQPSWNSTVTIAGSQDFSPSEWKLTQTRAVAPFFTNSGQQDPFAIVRGYYTAMVNLDFDPAQSESEFLYYLNNTQPTLSITASNTLPGTAACSVSIAAQVAAFNTGAISDGKEAFGWNMSALLVANTTNVGPSGAYGPLVVTVTNAVVAY